MFVLYFIDIKIPDNIHPKLTVNIKKIDPIFKRLKGLDF